MATKKLSYAKAPPECDRLLTSRLRPLDRAVQIAGLSHSLAPKVYKKMIDALRYHSTSEKEASDEVGHQLDTEGFSAGPYTRPHFISTGVIPKHMYESTCFEQCVDFVIHHVSAPCTWSSPVGQFPRWYASSSAPRFVLSLLCLRNMHLTANQRTS